MAMNRARRTSNINNILTYDTLGNSTLIANLTVEGLTGAGFVKADAAGLLSVDTAAYTVVTGATNYLTKITAPNTLGQSLVYDNGTSVYINTAVGVPGYSHAFQVMANGAGGLVVSTTDVASAIGIVNSASANKTWDISPYGNHLVINESGIATRIKFDAGGNITIGDITNSGHKLEVVGSFRTTGTNTLSALQGVGDRMVVANTNGVLTTQPIPTGSITGTGAAGQVNFWTGATTVSGSNNLFWDNTNSRLGIGTNAPANDLTISKTFDGVVRISTTNLSTGANAFSGFTASNSAGALVLQITGTGNTIVTPNQGRLTTGSAITNGLTIETSTTAPITIGTNNTIGMTMFGSSRNVVIQNGGTFSDGGQRLQVYGDTLLRGSGATSATSGLLVQNSASTNILNVRNDGRTISLGGIAVGGSGSEAGIFPSNSGNFATLIVNSSADVPTTNINDIILTNGQGNVAITSGFRNLVAISRGFVPTSGNGVYNLLQITTTINQTGGANGITRGLLVAPTLTAAADWRSIEWSNNSGWGLYGAGTANNYLAGNLLIGSTNNFAKLYVAGNTATATTQAFIGSQPGIIGALTNLYAYWSNIVGGSAVTVTNAYNFIATQSGMASSSITNLFGFAVESTLTVGTNNYGFYGNIASGTGRWNLYMNGTADNYMAGSLGIGNTSLTGVNLRVGKNITGATTALGIWVDGRIQSDVTANAILVNSSANSNVSGFNTTNVYHFLADRGSYSSTATNAFGYAVDTTLTYATNNYGFYGNIASATGRWNLYMNGTADNYLNGALLIGTATNDTVNKLQVTGTIVAGSASSTTGSVILRGSYSAGYLTILGTDGSSGGAMLSYGIQSAQNSTAGAFVSSSGITIPRSAYVQNGGHIWYTAPSGSPAIGTAVTVTKHMELYNSGNLVLGGGADNAVNRLQVVGDTLLKGSGNTSASTALTVQNSAATTMMSISNDVVNTQLNITGSTTAYFRANQTTANRFVQYGSNATTADFYVGSAITAYTFSNNGGYALVKINTATFPTVGGNLVEIPAISTAFSPTSGTADFTALIMRPVINQTGGANGITRGLYIQPTLTAAADWRSIEWSNNTGWGLYGVGTAKNYLNGTTLIGTTTDDGINKLQVAGSIASAGIMRSDAARTAATNDVSIALLGSNITTYAAGFTMGAAGYGLNAIYAQHEQRFGGNATFDAGNLNGAGLMLNRLAPTAAGTITMNQQAGRIRTMSNLHLQTQIQGNNNITVTHMSGLHIYGHYRTTGTITLTVGDYYGILLADPNEFSTGPTITGTNWGFYQQGAAPINAFEGSMLVGTTTTDANNRLVVSGNTRVTGNMTSAQFRLSALNTAPATSTSAGVLGEIRIDADNIYVCTATNTWKRVAIATF